MQSDDPSHDPSEATPADDPGGVAREERGQAPAPFQAPDEEHPPVEEKTREGDDGR